MKIRRWRIAVYLATASLLLSVAAGLVVYYVPLATPRRGLRRGAVALTHVTVGQDDLHADQVVGGHTVLAADDAEAAAQSETAAHLPRQ